LGNYVQQTRDFPRTGDTVALMTWLDYLSADHQVITSTPTNGERIFHGREEQSVAFIPRGK
jgi:hypothetical protein